MTTVLKTKGITKASPNSLISADQVRLFRAYNVPFGHTIEDCLRPEYWANECKKLNILDRIELRAEDMSFWAEAIVLAKSGNSAKLHLLQFTDFSTKHEEFNDEVKSKYKVVFAGLKGHRVIRQSDKAVISEGHATKEDAEKALSQHIKEMGS